MCNAFLAGATVTPNASTDPVLLLESVTERGIGRLVDAFYTRVRRDPELAPIFDRAIPSDWDAHLATMRDFWSSMMLTTGRYKGNPLAVHQRIEGMTPELFDRWLQLFTQTSDELFDACIASVFCRKATRVAESFKLALFNRPDRRWTGTTP